MNATTATVAAAPAAGSAARFEDIASSLARIPELIASIPDMIREPGANPTQSMLLIAILVTLVLLILVCMVLIAMRPPRRVPGPTSPAERSAAPAARRTVKRDRPGWLSPAVSRLLPASIVLVVAFGLLVVGGVTSGGRTACVSCHQDSPHSAATDADPHRAIACVACHEGGGVLARATFNTVRRFEHFVLGALSDPGAAGYGLPIASDSCRGCHRSALTGPLADTPRGLRMSHTEPLAAGAECVDCHVLEAGLIAASSGGMTSCLRCHGSGAVFSTCDRCHIGDPALAARTLDETGTLTASALVKNPRCDGCHKSQATCDQCHGIRMPHTQSFMGAGHARAAAVDIWDNGGRVCRKCHYKGHRSCTQCHSAFPGHPPAFKATHQAGDARTGCTCHQWDAKARGMTFCELCHPKGSAKTD
jgi:hypothetical protein